IGERIRVTEYGRDLEVRAEVVAGDGGSWRLPGPRRSSSLVTVERGDQVWFRRVEPDGSGELHLDLGPDRPVRGRVVDKAALPVEGALVWCGDATDRTVTTDAEGRFEIAVKSSTGVPIVVRKEGKAHKHVFVDVAATASETVVDFVVTDAATLVVQVAGTREALRDAFAFVLPGESPTTELQAFPFFAQGFWAPCEIGAEGRVQLEGLPRDCRPSIAIGGPALATALPIEVALRGDQPVVATAAVADREMLRGTVVDEHGKPVAGAQVACVRADTERATVAAGLWPSWLPPRDAAVGRSGDDGSFQLARASLRDEVVVIARAGAVVGWSRPLAQGDAEVQLVVPTSIAPTASIRIRPPQPSVVWDVRVDPVTEGRFVTMASDQPFVAQFEAAMVADLIVRVPDGEAWSAPREVRDFVIRGPSDLPVKLSRQ
ncbi:MAG: carboxypeptidase-like regulatory domain-containing protein, partial [Planctomycetota bacterium]